MSLGPARLETAAQRRHELLIPARTAAVRHPHVVARRRLEARRHRSNFPRPRHAREVWTVSFRYERGNAVSDTGSWEIEDIATKDVPASTFTVPKDFVHQFPLVAAPGVTR